MGKRSIHLRHVNPCNKGEDPPFVTRKAGSPDPQLSLERIHNLLGEMPDPRIHNLQVNPSNKGEDPPFVTRKAGSTIVPREDPHFAQEKWRIPGSTI